MCSLVVVIVIPSSIKISELWMALNTTVYVTCTYTCLHIHGEVSYVPDVFMHVSIHI